MEIVLYRITASESYVLTTACMHAEEAYNSEGVDKRDVALIALPRPDFDRQVSEEEIFRKYGCAAYPRRLIDLFVSCG